MLSITTVISERRKFVRYLVAGDVQFRSAAVEATGELLDIGTGGILVRSQTMLDKGTNLTAGFDVKGCTGTFAAKGRVVRTQFDVLAIMFLDPPAGLDELLAELANKGRAIAP